MWHEARRQEKKIRGIMVDYKRRADRRREFYEKIKQDPAQFLRMYGRPAKIHLDPAVSLAAEGPQSMMPWQGDTENMIDRFDVRANLDLIPEYNVLKNHRPEVEDDDEERQANYERYRTLVENEAAGLSEEQCLHQIYLDEHFGTLSKGSEEEKKKNADKKAAIGFVYEDSTPADKGDGNIESENEESEEDLETADLDVTIDVDSLTPDQRKEVNLCATQYGMKDDDFSRLLRKDKEELEALREAKQLEEAKAQFSGRKSRRERRAINERRQNPQRFSRPSYAARESPKYEPYKRPGSSSRSRSRSRSSEPAPVTFITSFGADSDDEAVVQGPSLPASNKSSSQKGKPSPQSSKCETPWLRRRSSSRNKSRSRSARSSSRSSSRSRSGRRRRRSSSKSSVSSSKSRTRSRSRSCSPVKSGSSKTSLARRSNGRNNSNLSRRVHRSHSHSMSRSRSRSRSRTSHSKSSRRSSSPTKKVAIKRYRRDSLSSSSELSGLESDEDSKMTSSSSSVTAAKLKAPLSRDVDIKADLKSGKISSKPLHIQSSTNVRETPQERLKRRMQAQISRQFKADKKAEITKITKQEQERLDREEEIRNLAFEMRRREREKRHREKEEEERERRARRHSRHQSSRSSSGSSSRKNSKSSSRSPIKSRSPVKSKSPERKRDDKDDRRRMGKYEERRRSGVSSPVSSSSEDRKRPEDRKWDGRREHSRWDGDGDRSGRSRGSSIRSTGRWNGDSGSCDNWGSDGHGWERKVQSWGDNSFQSRPPMSSRARPPLLKRPTSPLMSRPRPPNDPRLMEEPMDFS
ncbi:CLK4-associating serine/arginine rich protein-like [Biomphalaria glabrata]|uniref:CLK4-associating serine/arginine rich protein-like n=1 Tax=Biomphalaria glabrata TaxID=6526 RepID=A0A9W2ZUE3_BIOGL|nr:CLK4-associating serine/arginine rich protein-like [Biomphalaria glabrata]XP_055878570.1 CLK4-associating serine/arginine rich protein-like [Biomphalaria glabrata]